MLPGGLHVQMKLPSFHRCDCFAAACKVGRGDEPAGADRSKRSGRHAPVDVNAREPWYLHDRDLAAIQPNTSTPATTAAFARVRLGMAELLTGDCTCFE
jgi:hypothetical protein